MHMIITPLSERTNVTSRGQRDGDVAVQWKNKCVDKYERKFLKLGWRHYAFMPLQDAEHFIKTIGRNSNFFAYRIKKDKTTAVPSKPSS